jgi:hypothetical protein
VRWLGGVRYLHFAVSSVVVISPGFSVEPLDWLTVTARYYRGQVDIDSVEGTTGDNGYLLQGTAHLTPRFWIDGGYARSFESLPFLSVDYGTIARANILFGGFRFDPLPLTSFAASWQQQWRAYVNVGAATVTLTQRF